ELQLAAPLTPRPGGSLLTVTQVEAIALHGGRFLDDYPRYTAASAVAETAERLTPEEGEPSRQLFLLTLGAIRALAAAEHPATLVLDAYLLRAMAVAGWAPALDRCAVCATPGPHRAFSVPAGGTVCGGGRPPGAAPAAPAALAATAALAARDRAAAPAA